MSENVRMSFSLSEENLARYVPESRFGMWFLGTETWDKHVLARAIDDLEC